LHVVRFREVVWRFRTIFGGYETVYGVSGGATEFTTLIFGTSALRMRDCDPRKNRGTKMRCYERYFFLALHQDPWMRVSANEA
jgi:hypothetical protein